MARIKHALGIIRCVRGGRHLTVSMTRLSTYRKFEGTEGMGWVRGMGWDGMGWDGMGWDGMGTLLRIFTGALVA